MWDTRNLTTSGLVQLLERVTAEWEVADSIPGTQTILREEPRNEGAAFAARPSHGSDDQVKWRSRLQ